MKYMSASDSKAVDSSNYRFRNTADLLLYIQNTQTRNTVLAYVSATPFHILVTTRTESFVTGTCDHYHINIRFFPANTQCITHLCRCSRSKCISITFTVNSNTGNSIIVIKENIFVFSDGCPFSLCWHNLFLF